MSERINNNVYQKNMNMALIAEMIFRSKGITRAEIARRLELYRSTVTNITSNLIDAGIVIEAETGESLPQGGRKPIVLTLNRKFGFAAGIDLQPSHYRMCFRNIAGDTILTETGKNPGSGFESVVEHVMDRILLYVEQTGLPLLGVGIGLPGVIDSTSGIIRYSEPMKLYDYDFGAFWKSRYDVPFIIENDANCSAWHEIGKYPEMKSLLCVSADYHEVNDTFRDRPGIGVGFALAIDGEVYRGAHASAGEFCSSSWKAGGDGQTGYSENYLRGMKDDPEVRSNWLADVFSSAKPICSVFDPEAFIMLGEPFADEQKVREELRREVPDFLGVLERYDIKLIFDGEDAAVAKGAASMYMSGLFRTEDSSGDWKENMISLGHLRKYKKELK